MSDFQQSSLLNWATGCIDNEIHILTRLLYRNNNQHGKSIVFSLLKGMTKHLKLLNSESCQKLILNLDSSVRIAKQHKHSQLQFEEILSTADSVYLATRACVIAVNHGARSSECLIKLLGNKVFVPLFSVLLALTARIMKCLSVLAVSFQSRLEALTEQVKHIGVINEKYAPEVKAFLKNVALSDAELISLKSFKQALEVHSNCVPSSSSSSFKKKTLSFGELSQKSDNSSLLLAAGEDTGAIIGATVTVAVGSRADVSSDSGDDDAHCGMTIDSDVEEEEKEERLESVTEAKKAVKKDGALEVSNGKKRVLEQPLSPSTHVVKKNSSSSGSGAIGNSNSGTTSLAIDPISLFSADPVSVSAKDTAVGGTVDKTNFKKKKTLKALQRKADRMNREKAGGKDDIDDIFGGLA